MRPVQTVQQQSHVHRSVNQFSEASIHSFSDYSIQTLTFYIALTNGHLKNADLHIYHKFWKFPPKLFNANFHISGQNKKISQIPEIIAAMNKKLSG